MSSTLVTTVFAATALCAAVYATSIAREPAPKQDMAAAMAKAKQFTEVGAMHAKLERFVGKWTTESRFFMGGEATPPEKGTCEFRWKIGKRWLESESTASFMGQPLKMASWLGYDAFKMSFVMTSIQSMDNAMTRAEGDLTHDGKSLVMYGTLDEYLTGEHDKMVKYAWRFTSDDEMTLEVHDLPIGEMNTKVVEFKYTRVK